MLNKEKPIGDPMNSLKAMVIGLAYSKVVEEKYAGDVRRAIGDLTFATSVELTTTAMMEFVAEIMKLETTDNLPISQYDFYQKELMHLVLMTKMRLLSE